MSDSNLVTNLPLPFEQWDFEKQEVKQGFEQSFLLSLRNLESSLHSKCSGLVLLTWQTELLEKYRNRLYDTCQTQEAKTRTSPFMAPELVFSIVSQFCFSPSEVEIMEKYDWFDDL